VFAYWEELSLRRLVLRFLLLFWLLLLLTRRRLLTLGLWRPLLLMFLLLALLHLLLLLDMLPSQVLKLFLLLLLHLLPALVVRFLLIGTLALLRLLLFDLLALLVLLSMQILQLLLVLLLKLGIAVWRRSGLPGRRWPIIALRLVVSRLIRLHIRRLIIWPLVARRAIVGLRVRRLIVGPIIRICWPRGWWTVRPFIVWPIVGKWITWPVSVRRTIRLHIIGPIGRPVTLRSVVVWLLSRAILVLRCHRSIVSVLLRRRRPRRRRDPHRSLWLLLLRNLPLLRDGEWPPAILLDRGLLPLKSWRRRWRSALGYNRAVYDRGWRPGGTRSTRADNGLPRRLDGGCRCNDRSTS
jgi:hypothetical protein